MKKYEFVYLDRFLGEKVNFENMVKALETGLDVRVGTDALGHGDNNAIQEHYKRLLEEFYGDKLKVVKDSGVYSYSYTYKLKKRTNK